MSTIRVYAAAIRDRHAATRAPIPADDEWVRRFLSGLENEIGEPPKKKDPLTADLLLQSVATMPKKTLLQKRDRAIILLGFALAARRSEIASLNVADLRFSSKGVVVMTRRSKTDRRGRGWERAVPKLATPELCAVRALRAWLRASGIKRGPVFRTFNHGTLLKNRIDPRDVARILKKVTDGSLRGDFSGHSLRSGYITSAARAGASVPSIMQHTGHKSVDVLMGYVRRAKLFDDTGLSQIESALIAKRRSRGRVS
jgi:integrase